MTFVRSLSTFFRFFEYNFKNDAVFLAGWKQLAATLDGGISEAEVANKFLLAKSFYFSK